MLLVPILVSILICASCLRSAAQETSTSLTSKPSPIAYIAPTKDNYLKLADEMETTLRRDVLGVWFPRTVDNDNGGFYSNFTRDWQRTGSDGKFSVFQGRMTWMAAQIVMKRPDLKDQFLPVISHGMDYLRNVMWDKQDGGFFWGLDDKGQITGRYLMASIFMETALAFTGLRPHTRRRTIQRRWNWQKRLSAGWMNTPTTRSTVDTSNG